MFAYIDVVHLICLLMHLFPLSVVYLIISKILPFKIVIMSSQLELHDRFCTERTNLMQHTGRGGGQKVRALALQLFNDIRYRNGVW